MTPHSDISKEWYLMPLKTVADFVGLVAYLTVLGGLPSAPREPR